MNAMIKTLPSAVLIGIFLAGTVMVMNLWRDAHVAAAPQAPAMRAQGAAPEMLHSETLHADARQAEPFQVDATLVGTVELTWGATGAYSDTWTADELNILTDAATIDLMLLLEKGAGERVTSYVDLQNSLVFTAEHVISTTVVTANNSGAASAGTVTTVVGPQSRGSFAGNQLNLLSERISYTTEVGETVERQFRLTASPNLGSAVLTGEYRETVWGVTLRPLTIGGTFKLTELKSTPNNTNHVPVANPQTVTTAANRATAIVLTASDADGDPLTYEIVTDPTRGTLDGIPPSMTYTPRAGFAGTDSFTFRVNDSKVDSAAVAVSIVVEGGNGTNQPPTAGADTATTTAGVAVAINVLANDRDPDGDPLTVTINQQPQNGSAVVNGVTIVYTPNAGFSGTDSFTYTITDSKGATATATITVTVQPQVQGATIYLPLVNK